MVATLKANRSSIYRNATNVCLVLIHAIYANLTRSHKFVPHKFLFIHVNS